VTVRPLTTARMAAAQAAARRAVEAIERQARERTETGLSLDGLPDLSAEGSARWLLPGAADPRARGPAHHGLDRGRRWPAPPTPENIAAMMELHPVGARFLQELTLRQVLLNAAKNGCGPFAAGTSSPAESSGLPGRRPAVRTRQAQNQRTALPLPRARLEQPPGA
jgi:hypothetical protein